jgi:GNAT superfamily N-acetyltransferase
MPLKTYTLRERPELEDEFELRPAGLADVSPPARRAGQRALLARAVRDLRGVPAPFAILEGALTARREGRRPTALSALAAITDPGQRGRGLSAEIIRAMAALARQHGLGALVAPVRPTLKASYPLASMERYVRWIHPDGAPLDPWMRVHWRLGAEIVRVIPRALVIAGTVVEWEKWTEMSFPDSGPYVVPGALQPVVIDRERDEGRYDDPNVWMHHPIR